MEHPNTTRSSSPLSDDYISPLIERIRSRIKTLQYHSLEQEACILQDVVIRLRIVVKDLDMDSNHFREYQHRNREMVNLLKKQIQKMDSKIEEMSNVEDFVSDPKSWGPLGDLETLMDDFMDTSGPVAVAVQIINGTGATGDLIRSIRALSADETDQAIEEADDCSISTSTSERESEGHAEWLRDKIDDLRCKNHNNNNFVPKDALDQVMTLQAIQGVLRESKIERHKHQDVANYIQGGNSRIFGILIRIGYVDLVVEFIKLDQYQSQCSLDQRLPFGVEYLSTFLPENVAKKFFKEQWEYAAPIFWKSILPRDLDDQTILPICAEEEIAQGGFGTVHEITIHHAHHGFEGGVNRFIRKDFRVNRRRNPKANFELELRNLSILGNVQQHPYVIQLLSAYTWKNTYSLIFPLFENDLGEFMRNPRPKDFQSDSLIFIALAHLSWGLRDVHNFVADNIDLEKIGCHHDLKPDNIFIAGQSFVLADFGLSTFKNTSQSSKTMRKVGGTSYSAPECENIADPAFARGRAGRKSDIWAFGCIMAEMLTYVLKGSEGVKEFKERRTFTILGFTHSNFHKGTSTNLEVETWLSNLEIDAKAPRKALVRLIRRMLQMNPDDRPSAEDVSTELQAIVLQERTYPIDKFFDELEPKVAEEETAILFVEYARYKGWKEACGITPDGLQDTTGALWSLQFDECLDALSHYQDTLEQIRDRLYDNNRMHLLLPLRYANSRLEQLFPPEMQVDLQIRLEQRTVVSIEDSPLLAKMHGVLQSDRASLATSELAKVKLMTKAARESWDTPNEESGLYIDLLSIHLHMDLEHHSLGVIKTPTENAHRSVLIEWLHYGTQVLPETEAVQRAQRVKAVAQLLHSIPHPPGFRLLRCSHFFHDPENSRFGLVFELPFPVYIGEEPSKCPGITTLSKLLARSKDDHDLKMPSLGQRFRLAQTLASTIGEFRKVGWLHRKISPHNVVFPQIDGCPDYENPYLIGFSHSRQDSPNEFTEGPGQQHQNYQHPEYIKKPQRYRAEFDFYSLGIVLLEIARWQLLDHFTRGKAWQLLDEAKFRLALIQEARTESLAHKVGTQYCQAATTCLLGHDELAGQEESSDGSDDAAGLFQLRVISGLAKCSA